MILGDIAGDFYIATSLLLSLSSGELLQYNDRCYLLTMAVLVLHVNSVEAEKIESSHPLSFFWSVFLIYEGENPFDQGCRVHPSPKVTSLGLFTSLGSYAQLEFSLVV